MSVTAEKSVTAAVLVIGNEILSGRTHDTNLHYLAGVLTERGIVVAEARVVPDDEAVIIATVNDLRARHTYVFTTGGIGPTHDDITSACIAKAFGVALHRHPVAVKLLEAHYEPGQLTEARLKMTEVPLGASLIDNPVSKAPGFRMENVFVLAGVPRIAKAMMDGVLPTLAEGPPIHATTVSCTLGEGVIAEGLGAIQAAYPGLSVGSYPYFRAGQIGVSLVTRGTDRAEVEAATAAIKALVERLGGAALVAEGMG